VQHYQRKNLWKNFRKGCDIIFNKREEVKNELSQHNETIILEKTGLCENLEALNQQNLNMTDLKNAFSDIEATWTEINKNKSARHKSTEQRFEQAKKAFDQKISDLFNE